MGPNGKTMLQRPKHILACSSSSSSSDTDSNDDDQQQSPTANGTTIEEGIKGGGATVASCDDEEEKIEQEGTIEEGGTEGQMHILMMEDGEDGNGDGEEKAADEQGKEGQSPSGG